MGFVLAVSAGSHTMGQGQLERFRFGPFHFAMSMRHTGEIPGHGARVRPRLNALSSWIQSMLQEISALYS